MKAIKIYQTGGPEVMLWEDVTLAPLQPHEVRLKHHAVGVNYIDVYFRNGTYPAPLPFSPGNEAAGEIIETGSDVTEFKVGDRVAYVAPLGSYSEFRNIDPKLLIKLPDALSYDTGAAMMLKGMTAYYLLHITYKVKAGDIILVHAAAGGVGLLLCQWGKALGAHVIGTVGSKDKVRLAKDAGADDVILYNEEDWVARVAEITKGKKCNVVYDGIGKNTFPASLDCIRPLGLFASYGSASGPIEAFNPGILAQKGSLFMTRPTLNTYTAERKDLVHIAGELTKAIANGTITIDIHARYPLKEAVSAHRALEARATTGVTLLMP